MKLLSLRLRGAIGIREGLGLEDINIDFRHFSPGLIAIIGENGAGKTTVIENLQPFRFVRSHPGGLARQFYLKDSCRDLLIEMNGDEYRFLIEMNPTLKTPAIKSYVYKNGECLTPDGNEENYSAIVTKLFGDPDLFFSSLFMPQKRVPFSKVDIAKRKDLLLELIGAAHLQEKYEFANQSGKDIGQDIAKTAGEIDALAKATRPIEEIESDIRLCQQTLGADRLKIIQLDTDIRLTKLDLEVYQAKQTGQAVLQSQMSQARSRLNGLKTELVAAQSGFGEKSRQLKIFIETDQLEINRLTPQCSPGDEAAIDVSISMVERAKTDYLATVESRKEYDRLLQEQSEARYNLDVAKRDHEAALQLLKSDIEKAQRTFEDTKTKVDFKRKELIHEIARKTKATQILQTVPCQDVSISVDCRDACKSCQFLKDANAAVQELAQLSERLASGEASWTDLSAKLTHNIDVAKVAFDVHHTWESIAAPLQESIDAVKQSINTLGFEFIIAENIKRKYEECEKADYRGKKQKIQEARAKLETLYQKVADNRKRLEELHSEETSQIGELNQQVETIEAEIEILEPQIDVTIELRSRDSRDALKQLESSKQSTIETAAKSEASIARLMEDKSRSDKCLEELNITRAKLAALQSDLADWEHLAQALSRTGGFQSMLVESAGAEMTPFANELLVLYGRPWTIEISTCRPSADGKKLVDGFFVTVNTPNGPRELSDLSGGEEVIVDQVIYDSIANMLRRRSGLVLQTAIKDESDGALDEDRALDYIKAVEAAHHVSGMHHTLLISHRETIQDLIPNRLRFVKGQGITMEVA